jgi:hypothetical protein
MEFPLPLPEMIAQLSLISEIEGFEDDNGQSTTE